MQKKANLRHKYARKLATHLPLVLFTHFLNSEWCITCFFVKNLRALPQYAAKHAHLHKD